MELHELQVAQHRPGAQGQRHPSPVDDRRVGGRGEDLAQPAAREHDRAAQRGADAVVLALAHHVQGQPATAPSSAGNRSRTSACSITWISGDRRTAATSARWISAPVASPPACDDPVAMMPALTGQLESPPEPVSKLRPERRSARAAPSGPSVTRTPDSVLVAQAGAGDQRVVEVLIRGVAGSDRGGDPALGPSRRAGREDVLGHDQHAAELAGPQRGRQPGDARSRPRPRRPRRASQARPRPAAAAASGCSREQVWRTERDRDVVDQPGRSDARGDEQPGRAGAGTGPEIGALSAR